MHLWAGGLDLGSCRFIDGFCALQADDLRKHRSTTFFVNQLTLLPRRAMVLSVAERLALRQDLKTK